MSEIEHPASIDGESPVARVMSILDTESHENDGSCENGFVRVGDVYHSLHSLAENETVDGYVDRIRREQAAAKEVLQLLSSYHGITLGGVIDQIKR